MSKESETIEFKKSIGSRQAVKGEMVRVSQRLSQRIKEFAGRYAFRKNGL